MRLFHRTTRQAADAILREGFRDAAGTYLTAHERTGVWLSNVPLDENEGAAGRVLLAIEGLEESVFAAFEWVEEGKPYREALVPAVLINGKTTIREIDEDGMTE